MPRIDREQHPMVEYSAEATFGYSRYMKKRGQLKNHIDSTRGLLERELIDNCGGDYIDVDCEMAKGSGNKTEVTVTISIVSVGYGEDDDELVAKNIVDHIYSVGKILDANGVWGVSVDVAELTPSESRTLYELEQNREDFGVDNSQRFSEAQS